MKRAMLSRSSGVRTALVGLVVLFGLACGPKPADPPPASQPPPVTPPPSQTEGGDQCSVDADCVPASCCHPATCVPVAQKPDCKDQMCTMQCAPNTLDCGGRCACEAGSCKAILGTP